MNEEVKTLIETLSGSKGKKSQEKFQEQLTIIAESSEKIDLSLERTKNQLETVCKIVEEYSPNDEALDLLDYIGFGYICATTEGFYSALKASREKRFEPIKRLRSGIRRIRSRGGLISRAELHEMIDRYLIYDIPRTYERAIREHREPFIGQRRLGYLEL